MTSRGFHAQQPLLSLQYIHFFLSFESPPPSLFQWALGEKNPTFTGKTRTLTHLTPVQLPFFVRLVEPQVFDSDKQAHRSFHFGLFSTLRSSGCPTSFVLEWTCNVGTKLAPSCLHFMTYCLLLHGVTHFEMLNRLEFRYTLSITRQSQSAVTDEGWCIMMASSVSLPKSWNLNFISRYLPVQVTYTLLGGLTWTTWRNNQPTTQTNKLESTVYLSIIQYLTNLPEMCAAGRQVIIIMGCRVAPYTVLWHSFFTVNEDSEHSLLKLWG